eukprot:scaffold2787_cov33-Phaeocystis_antarctica.AAC.1
MGVKTTSFFAGRPERGNHGLCPTSHGAEVDVHRPQGGQAASLAARRPTGLDRSKQTDKRPDTQPRREH